MTGPGEREARLKAGADLIGRLGAGSLEIRYSEPEQRLSPFVWIAIAAFPRYGAPPQVAAGLEPVRALEKLLEQLVDGGQCKQCGQMTALLTDHTDSDGPLALMACCYAYDPELKTYRRGCEGE
jgi:hypothetical protein